MRKKYKVEQEKISIFRDKKTEIYSLKTVKGACLKILIDNKNNSLAVADICNKADELLKNFGIKPFKDRGRDVRSLNANGLIISTKKGYYMFTGEFGENVGEFFTPKLREKILKRDNYKCQSCGMGNKRSRDLVADHIIPRPKNGKATYENGMTLCTRCNNIKRDYGGLSFGKKMFEKHLTLAEKKNDINHINFLKEVLGVFKKFNQN